MKQITVGTIINDIWKYQNANGKLPGITKYYNKKDVRKIVKKIVSLIDENLRMGAPVKVNGLFKISVKKVKDTRVESPFGRDGSIIVTNYKKVSMDIYQGLRDFSSQKHWDEYKLFRSSVDEDWNRLLTPSTLLRECAKVSCTAISFDLWNEGCGTDQYLSRNNAKEFVALFFSHLAIALVFPDTKATLRGLFTLFTKREKSKKFSVPIKGPLHGGERTCFILAEKEKPKFRASEILKEAINDAKKIIEIK